MIDAWGMEGRWRMIDEQVKMEGRWMVGRRRDGQGMDTCVNERWINGERKMQWSLEEDGWNMDR